MRIVWWRGADEASTLRHAMAEQELRRLARGLEHSDWEVRLKAVEALEKSTHPGAIGLLGSVLHDQNEAIIEAAALALLRSKDRAAFEPLIRAFNDEDVEVGEAVQSVLVFHREQWFVDACIRALGESEDPGVREAAADALGYPLGETTAIDALQGALDDPEEAVREAAADSLNRLSRTSSEN